MTEKKFRVQLVADKTIEVTVDHADLLDEDQTLEDVAEEMARDAAFNLGINPPGVTDITGWDMTIESVEEV